MSGKPNPEGVKNLKQACRDLIWARERIVSVEAALKENQESLAKYKAEARKARETIVLSMEQMDVAAPGNSGWNERNFEFLLLLSKE